MGMSGRIGPQFMPIPTGSIVDTVAHSADLHPAQMRYDVTSRDVPGCLTIVMLAAWYAAC